MKIETKTNNNVSVAVIRHDTPLITDVQSALDPVMTVK